MRAAVGSTYSQWILCSNQYQSNILFSMSGAESVHKIQSSQISRRISDWELNFEKLPPKLLFDTKHSFYM